MADTQTTRESTNPNPMAGTVSSDPPQGTAWPVTLAPSAAVLTRATIRGTFSLIGDDPVANLRSMVATFLDFGRRNPALA